MILATKAILGAKDTSALSALIMISAQHAMKMEQGVQDTHKTTLCSAFLREVILVCLMSFLQAISRKFNYAKEKLLNFAKKLFCCCSMTRIIGTMIYCFYFSQIYFMVVRLCNLISHNHSLAHIVAN